MGAAWDWMSREPTPPTVAVLMCVCVYMYVRVHVCVCACISTGTPKATLGRVVNKISTYRWAELPGSLFKWREQWGWGETVRDGKST